MNPFVNPFPEPPPRPPGPPPGGPTARELELERQLASARAELDQLQELLAELPGIFERKFEQRLQPVLQQSQLLQDENLGLKQQLRQLPAAGQSSADPQAGVEGEPPRAQLLLMPELPPRPPSRWPGGDVSRYRAS